MSATVRALTTLGMERFRAQLERLRKGTHSEPPSELLEGGGYTTELPVEIAIEPREFGSRLELAKYLVDRLGGLDANTAERIPGLWAWLSLYFFEQVCPVGSDGLRRPGRDYRHIPESGYRHRLRHLLYGPYLVYRRHGDVARLLLTGPVHTESGVYHEIASRQDLIANPGVLEAASELYFDSRRNAPKIGAHTTKPQPGTVRRFVRVLQQLDLTYDIYGLRGEQILELLPGEFDAWRPGAHQSNLELPGSGRSAD